MKTYRDTLFCALFLLTIVVSQAFPVSFEERKPRDEKSILVPRGARPMLKEEYPRKQLVVERIRARHKPILIIPFVRSWNTAALTALRGFEMEKTPEFEPSDFELGFALHSQRMRVGALQNREYFQRETEGFPENWYRPLENMAQLNRTSGYMSTTFMHLAAKRMRRKYTGFSDFTDRIGGIMNAVSARNKQVTLTASRYMHNLRGADSDAQPRVKNTAGISYKMPGESVNRLELHGSSVWSTLTDADQQDFRYISGVGSAIYGHNLTSSLDVEIRGKGQISTVRNQTNSAKNDSWNVRKSGWLEVLGSISMAKHLKLKLNASALYDSEYEFFFTPTAALALSSSALEINAGIRKRAILPDHDEIYWPSKLVRVNEDLEPENFWEGFGSLKLDIIARLKLMAQAAYSHPNSRIAWEQSPEYGEYVWEPKNVPTADALTGEASLMLNLIGDLNTFASCRYQRFDDQRFDPEIVATGGLSYGNRPGGSIAVGASYWTFQPLGDMNIQENFSLVYLRVNKSIRKVLTIFVDGRYTFNNESILYYQGMPQAGRIVSVGANIVFGGLE